MNTRTSPNHALQRTAPHVTAAASGLRLSPAVQPPRRAPRSLSLGSFVSPAGGKRLALINPKSPKGPKIVEVKGVEAGLPVCGIPTVCGNLVAFASRRDGKVVTLDLSTPEHPVVVRDRCYDLSQGNCDRVAFHKGRMLIPAGHYGLFMEK